MSANLEPGDLVLFARVVDEGSFTRAAGRLGLPKSTVSRRVAALESELGERLLLRTTRKLTVTDFGRAVAEHGRRVADDVAAAASLAQHRQAEPSGRLRVTMPGDFANLVLTPFLAEFLVRHPAIELELDLGARFVDLIGENFDVALRMGDLDDDASLAARRVAVFSRGVYASPDYVARRGAPDEPEALMEHDALRVLGRNGDPMPWTLTRGAQRWTGIPPGRATVNSPETLMQLSLAGLGLAIVNDYFAEPHTRAGRLVRVLADWNPDPVDVWAVFPGRRLMPARSRAFVDLLTAKFAGPECREIEARLRGSRAPAAPSREPAKSAASR